MKELIDEKAFIAVLRWIAIALPVAGLLAALIGWRIKQSALCTLGLTLSIAGPLLWLLWLAYGRVVNQYGLDSVKGLGVNIAVFAAAGIAAGLIIGLFQRRRKPKTE
jgi:hypothetical protein